MFRGFTAAEGYDLRHIERWTQAQHDRVQSEIKELRQLLSSPYRLVTPRDRGQRSTLKNFTLQVDPRQKRFVVHVQSPQQRVSVRRQRGHKHPGITIESAQRFGGFGQMQFWFFNDYNEGYSPETREEFIEATRAMLPDMPDWGYFALWSRTNGVITIPQPKNSLLRVISRFFDEGESFGGDKIEVATDILQGWVLQGNEADAEKVYIARQQRRTRKADRYKATRARRRVTYRSRTRFVLKKPAKKKVVKKRRKTARRKR